MLYLMDLNIQYKDTFYFCNFLSNLNLTFEKIFVSKSYSIISSYSSASIKSLSKSIFTSLWDSLELSQLFLSLS